MKPRFLAIGRGQALTPDRAFAAASSRIDLVTLCKCATQVKNVLVNHDPKPLGFFA